jgi:hypothetical protein
MAVMQHMAAMKPEVEVQLSLVKISTKPSNKKLLKLSTIPLFIEERISKVQHSISQTGQTALFLMEVSQLSQIQPQHSVCISVDTKSIGHH